MKNILQYNTPFSIIQFALRKPVYVLFISWASQLITMALVFNDQVIDFCDNLKSVHNRAYLQNTKNHQITSLL